MTKDTSRKPMKVFTVADVQLATRERFSNSTGEVIERASEILDFTGRLTCSLVEKWGVVAAMDGGEDAAGRAKLAIMPPEAVVARAYDIASMVEARLRAAGHFHQLPDINELYGLGDDA